MSSMRYVTQFKLNVYRHYLRQGRPTESHSKIMIYMLIGSFFSKSACGSWLKISSYKRQRATVSPKAMAEIIVKNVDRLEIHVSPNYKKAAIICVIEELGSRIVDVNKPRSQLAKAFEAKVLKLIERVSFQAVKKEKD